MESWKKSRPDHFILNYLQIYTSVKTLSTLVKNAFKPETKYLDAFEGDRSLNAFLAVLEKVWKWLNFQQQSQT